MKYHVPVLLIVCLCSAVMPAVMQAQPSVLATIGNFQSLDSLQTLAEQQVRNSLATKVGTLYVQAESLDPRLHLVSCGTTPQAFLPSGTNLNTRATVGVRCNSGAQWTIYVTVSIESEAPVLTLSRAVSHDTALSAGDVTVSTRRLPGLSSGYLTDVAQLSGNTVKHDLTAGILLTPAMLQPSILIRRGQQVTMLASSGGIDVRADAVALMDGSANSRIRVKNINTAKVVEGIVDTAAVVHVAL